MIKVKPKNIRESTIGKKLFGCVKCIIVKTCKAYSHEPSKHILYTFFLDSLIFLGIGTWHLFNHIKYVSFTGIDYDGRSVSGDCCLVDIDPEMIRKSVRKLMQQVAQVEREKEEYKVQLQAAKKQLEEAANQQTRCENKMSKLQQMLRNANEEKANLEAKLVQKQLALQSVEDALKLKSDELGILTDKHKSLESQLNSVQEQKNQTEVSFRPISI